MKRLDKFFGLCLLLINMVSFSYVQHNKIIVCTQAQSVETLYKVLDKFDLKYQTVKVADINDDQSLFIITGDLAAIAQFPLPKNYIIYHTGRLLEKVPLEYIALLSNAVAVWDVSFDNINRYRKNVKNFYYVPGSDYAFLDPVILPCFLPTEALDAYRKLLMYSNTVGTDISSHLPSLFFHCLMQEPSLIVEAGVRGGESTIALHAAAQLKKAYLVGIDIEDCSKAYSTFSDTLFLQIDDMKFSSYLSQLSKKPRLIDLVFIDTSHEYRHTMGELGVFVPLLAEQGALAFHDSNVTPLQNNAAYERIDGTGYYVGPVNPRGVTQAIKEFFGLSFNEYAYLNKTFLSRGFEWNIVHYPFCNGLTVIKKIRRV